MRTLFEIELLNNDDLMRSSMNYKYQDADPIFRGLYNNTKCFVGHHTTKLIVDSIQLSESEDENLKLKWDLHCAFGEDKMNPVNNLTLIYL